jgi:hypothetical protein
MRRDSLMPVPGLRPLALALVLLWALPANAQKSRLPERLIALESAEGERLLVESKARRDYFALSETFVAQKSQSLCGTASAVMVLNALPIPAPEVPEWSPYRSFTQDNFFNDKARALGVARGGLTLEQLHQLIETQPAEARVTYASDLSLEDFRRIASVDMADPTGFIIVNFLRSALDEDPKGPIEASLAGHYSPIAAYHEGTDRFLMLDVARYKYSPAWIEASELYAAMKATDLDSGKSRGFVQVRAAAGTVAPNPTPSHSKLLPLAIGVATIFFAAGALTGSLVTRRRMRNKQKAA